MKTHASLFVSAFLLLLVSFGCNKGKTNGNAETRAMSSAAQNKFGGFATEVAWGQHLVGIGGCNDCHTPKKMTAMGPVPDTSMLLSGHPANAPVPGVDRMDIEKKGLIVTNDLTAWVGPWGVSFAANLTPDETGIGNWTQAQFFKAIREGKFMGMDGTRMLLPPMSFVAVGISRNMTDDELAAIFAYLKSIKPVHNTVPQPLRPVMAMKQQ